MVNESDSGNEHMKIADNELSIENDVDDEELEDDEDVEKEKGSELILHNFNINDTTYLKALIDAIDPVIEFAQNLLKKMNPSSHQRKDYCPHQNIVVHKYSTDSNSQRSIRQSDVNIIRQSDVNLETSNGEIDVEYVAEDNSGNSLRDSLPQQSGSSSCSYDGDSEGSCDHGNHALPPRKRSASQSEECASGTCISDVAACRPTCGLDEAACRLTFGTDAAACRPKCSSSSSPTHTNSATRAEQVGNKNIYDAYLLVPHSFRVQCFYCSSIS